MKYDCVHRHLSVAFYNLGFHIGKNPKWYIFVPLAATILFLAGFSKLILETRVEYLFTPIDGRSNAEKIAIETLFAHNKSRPLDFSRRSRLPPFGSVIALAKDGGTILRESILDELVLLDFIAVNINVTWNNSAYTFRDICLKGYGGECFKNDGLEARGKIDAMKRGKFKMKYPIDIDKISYSFKSYGYSFGGVIGDEDGYVQEVKAFRLFYILENIDEKQVTEKWMSTFIDKLSNANFDKIIVYTFSRTSLDEDANKITLSSYPLLILAVIFMVVFGAVSCMTTDWVHSNPWAGVSGCISSLLGVGAAFGSLLLFGAEYVDINIAIVFLMLGIGMDDSFIILAAWKHTNPNDEIAKRMGDAYAESAMSISVTSLTNLMANCTGLITSYRIIKIYSLYAGASVIFVYVAQITFFGGCLALCGIREKNNRHGLAICYPIERHPSKGIFRKLFIEGCTPVEYLRVNSNRINHSLTKRAFGVLGDILSKTYTKVAVISVFLCHFAMAIYFIKDLKVAFDYSDAFPYYSDAKPYIINQYKYFTEFSFRIHVVINGTLDYSDPSVRKDIERLLYKIETEPHMAGETYTESWLKQYLEFIDDKRISWFSLSNYNVTNPEDFVEGLRDVFLNLKGAERFRNDIRFSEDGKKIVASRFMMQGTNISDSVIERKFINSLWKAADSSKYQVYIHNFYFFLYDLSSGVEKTTIQCLFTSSVLVIVVSLLFFPSFICAFCMATTVIFIEVELVGYMALWGVKLNIISMVCLVLSVGLSVDYAAHISFAFISNTETDPNAKLKTALLNVGYPITQGCVSTIIGVVVLSYCPVTSVVIFFKIVFLLMIFSLYHGLLLIPVLLSIWEEICRSYKNKCHFATNKESSKTFIRNQSTSASGMTT